MYAVVYATRARPCTAVYVYGPVHLWTYTRAENGRVYGRTRLVHGRITAVYMYTARRRCAHCRVMPCTPVHGPCTRPRTGRVHCPYMAVYTARARPRDGRVHVLWAIGTPVARSCTRVYGPCTRAMGSWPTCLLSTHCGNQQVEWVGSAGGWGH